MEYLAGMKTLDECLFEFLTTDLGMLAAIGTREWLFPDFLKQNQPLPAVTYSMEEDHSIMTQQGPSALREGVYLFEVWDTTAKSAGEIEKALRDALDGFRGPMGDVDYVVALFAGSTHDRDPETMVFNVSMRFKVFYHEDS